MAEAIAQKKFSCPACGAEASWTPAKQALVCAFCGTASPAQIELAADGTQVVRELDLAAALRAIPDDARGWQAKKTSVRCQSCQAISVFDPERVGQRCDFCGSSALVPHDEIKEAFRPESLLPMKVSESQVRESIRRWYGSRWFAPNRLRKAALTDTVRGLYIPYWTFDAQVRAEWTAESGYYYYETETYTDANGKTQSRQVQKTRWEPSSGSLDHFFDDELIAASRGVDAELLRRVEPFPTDTLTPYKAGFLSGWVVERYQIDLVAAAQHARQIMEQKMISLCARQVPGDTHRNLRVRSDFTGQTFKHILVPVWLLSYHYGARAFQVVVNGSTGAIAGRYPKSWVKILLAVLAGLAVVAGVVLLGGR
ncbi:MAG TPA: zinc ribbon domain-containing protein [Candidatus Paceibacterota bacterium]|nr:zinc ribbon domain-containing protein [Verrucomicrobiota bacterium]HOX01953.1 zinc ribbon domain-containing protein [Verrucomicrobiota bacterium]HRZ44004.1 zinc ribbon domain-containing protein [Candidatus Paceibacterota bacterium]HRZ93164.1 zinc ribbon domain-containing protein [Candidatus Paceibacterota bacterium]